MDLDTEQIRADKLAVLAELPAQDARGLQEAAWAGVDELAKASTLPDSKAPERPALPRGAPLTETALAGGWSGSLAFSPAGLATLTLELDPPTSKGLVWGGHEGLEFHSKDAADVDVDLADLRVATDELAFSLPKAVFELDVHFRAILLAGGELGGRAGRRQARSRAASSSSAMIPPRNLLRRKDVEARPSRLA